MKPIVTKIIVVGLILGGIYYLFKNYPDYAVVGIGIALILIVGMWMNAADQSKD